ncbi:MAG: hypothetical protein GJ680_18520 [Alteromonadaceae bacterium]|nr:hypothetical protein [Alteromonadaceae bacterium]
MNAQATELRSESAIKRKLSDWLGEFLSRSRQAGKRHNRHSVAQMLGITDSCLSQYTNPSNSKKAPWEFQVKMCFLVGKSIIELHPELNEIRIQHF